MQMILFDIDVLQPPQATVTALCDRTLSWLLLHAHPMRSSLPDSSCHRAVCVSLQQRCVFWVSFQSLHTSGRSARLMTFNWLVAAELSL